MPIIHDENVLVGFDTSDDAGAYKLDDGNILIQTLDFFTPIADDPYIFGQIAAANSLSDVYAMGGKPLLALNIVCYPCDLGNNILKEILRGGAEKVKEAGAVLIGGHSIEDKEPKYGLSVTGIIKTGKVFSNDKAEEGDYLVLTKPMGTGVITTAIKAEEATPQMEAEVYRVMAQLNDKASCAMIEADANACTDVTGFGLIGHLKEMVVASHLSCVIWTDEIPFIEGAIWCVNDGFVPGGTRKNEIYLKDYVDISAKVEEEVVKLIFDPQTSGGLLISVAEDKLGILEAKLSEYGCDFAVIGKMVKKEDKAIKVLKERN